jgi:hypothetical protein
MEFIRSAFGGFGGLINTDFFTAEGLPIGCYFLESDVSFFTIFY